MRSCTSFAFLSASGTVGFAAVAARTSRCTELIRAGLAPISRASSSQRSYSAACFAVPASRARFRYAFSSSRAAAVVRRESPATFRSWARWNLALSFEGSTSRPSRMRTETSSARRWVRASACRLSISSRRRAVRSGGSTLDCVAWRRSAAARSASSSLEGGSDAYFGKLRFRRLELNVVRLDELEACQRRRGFVVALARSLPTAGARRAGLRCGSGLRALRRCRAPGPARSGSRGMHCPSQDPYSGAHETRSAPCRAARRSGPRTKAWGVGVAPGLGVVLGVVAGADAAVDGGASSTGSSIAGAVAGMSTDAAVGTEVVSSPPRITNHAATIASSTTAAMPPSSSARGGPLRVGGLAVPGRMSAAK